MLQNASTTAVRSYFRLVFLLLILAAAGFGQYEQAAITGIVRDAAQHQGFTEARLAGIHLAVGQVQLALKLAF